MSKRFEICESCIDLHLPGADREAVLRHLAGLLVRQGLVEPAYVEKILEREASCPTGLPFPAMTIALLHGRWALPGACRILQYGGPQRGAAGGDGGFAGGQRSG